MLAARTARRRDGRRRDNERRSKHGLGAACGRRSPRVQWVRVADLISRGQTPEEHRSARGSESLPGRGDHTTASSRVAGCPPSSSSGIVVRRNFDARQVRVAAITGLRRQALRQCATRGAPRAPASASPPNAGASVALSKLRVGRLAALRVSPRPASVASPWTSGTRPGTCGSLDPHGSSKHAALPLSWPSRHLPRPPHLFPVGRAPAA